MSSQVRGARSAVSGSVGDPAHRAPRPARRSLRGFASTTTPNDHPRRRLLFVARLHALVLPPGGHDVAAAARAPAVRVVDRVHDRAAHRRPDAEVALPAGLAPPDVLVRLVADDADGGPALRPNPTALTTREPERDQTPLAGDELGARPCAAGHLRPAARLELDGVHDGAYGYPVEGERVAHVHLGVWPALHDGADREVARREDVALLAVVVVQEGDVGRAVRVVLDRRDRRGHTVLAPLEVYETVAALVSAADVAGGYAAVVVAPARLVQLGGQLLLGIVLRDRVARQNRGVPAARAGRPVTSRRHTRPPRTALYARPRPA